jgi:hypothetical protein
VLRDIVGARFLDARVLHLTLSFPDGSGEAGLLLGEQFGSDLVVVVAAQQLATLGHQVLDTVTGPPSAGLSAGLAGRRSGPLELPADGGLQVLVVADEPQTQYGCPVQPDVRPAGLGAALAPVVAAVELATGVRLT